jgi:hypothetical protein
MRVVSPSKQLHLLDDGGWWEVTLARAPVGMPELLTTRPTASYMNQMPVDAVHGAGLSQLGRTALYGRAGVYASAKRQLSRKEMRDLGLR